MQCRTAAATTALSLLAITAAVTLSPPALHGQSAPHGPFDYVRAVDRGRAALTGLPNGPATQEQVLRGRLLVVASACASCHNGGKNDPSDPKWLANYETFQIGPFKTYAANL